MNKLRLIKIYELRNQVHPIEASIINLLDELVEVPDDDYIDYKKDVYIYFSYDTKTNTLFLNNYLIYQLFKCTAEETNEIMNYLLKKHLKLKINE